MGRLDGKTAVITGSGRGIGKATALLFAQEGAWVVVNDIDEGPAAETAREIQAAGGKAVGCAADLTDASEAQRLVDTAVQRFGKLDLLINNAGLTRDALIHRMTDEQWHTVININLTTTFNCIRGAARYMMKENHNGAIVTTSSVAGVAGNIGQINYSAAKAGLMGLTKTVAKEWNRFGVRCNCVAWGFVDTRLTREKETGEDVAGERVGIPKKVRDGMLDTIAGKVMLPEDAARVVLFLASDDARFINGQVLTVAAGMYM